jgi:hypothetical protein|tara:strand:- start:446 stop:841 length:396 start_codon:yes stop_codon:yes gene_type:complete
LEKRWIEMVIDRRQHQRIEVGYWVSLKYPLLGTITGDIKDMSVSGVSLLLDEEINFFVMMELDARIHGEGWDESMPSLPVQVVRVSQREVALLFSESLEDCWTPPEDDDRGYAVQEGRQYGSRQGFKVTYN